MLSPAFDRQDDRCPKVQKKDAKQRVGKFRNNLNCPTFAAIMELLTLFLLALSLSFDSFAVSVSSGLMLPGIRFPKAVIIALSLAFFQAFMPLLGWTAGTGIRNYLADYDHWIAFGLLSLLGIKMITESLKADEERNGFNPLKPAVLLTMSLATSIDAFVVGISFALIETPETPVWLAILIPVLMIGSVTFIMSMLGILFGKKAGSRLGKRMELLGGIILIGIGLKILTEHLGF
ncbi:putative manganese efflux pump MntP [bioreactor metagenome]|jgi:putative Mn2+ efflux pump MntP|uniref:Putative manganese efflux pump MntP n=2 Tax=root TaxID=1 RepID=A0A644U8E2_9ZZZZ